MSTSLQIQLCDQDSGAQGLEVSVVLASQQKPVDGAVI